jgi:hypothetical protein
MRPLSATECISPAIDRMKLVLFTPFRAGRTWKLSATSYLAVASSMFSPFPLFYLAYIPMVRHFGNWAVYALVAAVLLLTVLYLYIFYLCTRLKFAYFDIVVNRGEFVAPAWRKYGPQTVSWTGFKMLLGSAFALAVSVPVAAYIRHMMPVFLSIKPGQPPPSNLLSAIFAGYGLMLLLFGSFGLVSGLLGDFIVPSLALEDTGLKEAFRRMWKLIAGEPAEFLLYTLLKTVLGIAVYLGALIAAELAVFVVLIVVGIVGLLLHLIGVPTPVLWVVGAILFFVVELFLLGYGLILAMGPIVTFLDAYALYFLGGRYPLLGDLLERSTPQSPYNYPIGYQSPPVLPPLPPA